MDSTSDHTRYTSTFCKRCVNIDFEALKPGRSFKQVSNSTPLSPLVHDASCPLCQVFELLSGEHLRSREEAEPGQFFLHAFYSSRTHPYRNNIARLLNKTPDSVSFTVFHEDELCTLDENEMWDGIKLRTKGWMAPIAMDPTTPRFAARLLAPEVDFSLLKAWLDFCAKYHRTDSCGAFPGRKGRPTRVIDCATRKLVTLSPGFAYVTLSYVWGSVGTSNVKTESSRDDLAMMLPNTIEDAIITTLRLGYNYLWVDRYCINQGDEEERDAQISQMDLIYSNAEVTLVAAAGSDPSAGLPGVSSRPRVPQRTLDICGLSYAMVLPDPDVMQPISTWYSRGWTYQEAILSRRRLHFSEDQTYFTCGSMFCRDVMASPLEACNFKNKGKLRTTPWYQHQLEQAGYPVARGKILTPNTKIPNPLHETFTHISEYSGRSLSDSNDVLNGILGVFQRLKALHPPFRHFHGLPIVFDATLMKKTFEPNPVKKLPITVTEKLATVLSWYHTGFASRRHGFPSWSWIGWHGKVVAPGRLGGYIRNTHELFVQVEQKDGALSDWDSHVSLLGMHNDSHYTAQTLVLQAVIYTIEVCSATTQQNSDDEIYITETWHAWLQLPDGQRIPTPCHFTPLNEGSHSNSSTSAAFTYTGLVLGTRYDTHLSQAPNHSLSNSLVGPGVLAPLAQPVVVILLVDEHDGVTQRIGIVEYPLSLLEFAKGSMIRRKVRLG